MPASIQLRRNSIPSAVHPSQTGPEVSTIYVWDELIPESCGSRLDVQGQTGVQPRYLEEIEQHLRGENQADSTRHDSTRQPKVVFAGETTDDPQKKHERSPVTGKGKEKHESHYQWRA